MTGKLNIMDERLSQLYEAILDGDANGAAQVVQAVLEEGVDPEKVLNEGMIAAMKEVGQRFEEGDYFVPEMLIAARAMQAGLSLLRPYLVKFGVKPVGKVVIGTVKGDLHDIGKNLVAMMLEGAGFEINDLGTDVPPNKFIDAIQDGANIVGLSALLTTTMPSLDLTIKAIEAAGLRDQTRIIVGGAPVTTEYATQIGADGYAPDASQAATLAKSLIS